MNDLITTQSITTLSAASTSVFLVCSVIDYVLDFNPKILGLVISFITSYTIARITTIDLTQFSNIFIMALNGFLIYATAIGINAVTGKHEPPGPGGGYGGGDVAYKTKSRSGEKAFFRSWY